MTTTPETPSEGLPDSVEPAAENAAVDDVAAVVPAAEPRDATQPIPADDTQPVLPADDTQPVLPADDTQPVLPADDTQPVLPADDTQPVPADDTQPIPAPVQPILAPVQPILAPVQPIVAPTPVPPYTGQPHGPALHLPAGQPYAGPPYAGQPYAGEAHPGQPYLGQPQPGQAHPGQPYPTQQYPAQPYQGQPYAGQPYAGQPYPGQPAGAPPGAVQVGAAPRPRRWLPVLATLVVVLLLAIAAVAVASRGLGGPDTATGSKPGSLATIGQQANNAVPVAGSTSANPNWPAVVQAVQSSVVAIEVTTSSGQALGSGVVIDAAGHVLTNNHVVSGATAVRVTLDDGRLYDATIVGTDATTDLAVVAITHAPKDLVVSELGDSSKVTVGESVMAVGNPLGLANTVTTGIVSAIDRPVSTATDNGGSVVTNAIQIDAAVNPGNSGGPLFNAQGQVIGITSSIATTSSQSGSIGLGFAIPSNLVQSIASQLIATGTAKHAYLGVGLVDGTATADGVTRRGAQVKSVTDSSPASAAGLAVGDVIVAMDGRPVGGAESLTAFVRAMSSGQKTVLTVVRNGKAIDVTATLAARQETATPAPNGSGAGNGSGNGSGNGLPGDLGSMTPQQLWEWLQQQQQQGGSGSGQG